MLSRKKIEAHLIAQDDVHPEVLRFAKDMLILIEFGQFEPDEDELNAEDNAEDNAFDNI